MTHAAMMALGNDEVNTYDSAAVLMELDLVCGPV